MSDEAEKNVERNVDKNVDRLVERKEEEPDFEAHRLETGKLAEGMKEKLADRNAD
jgi:hypothetical protein